MATKAYADGSTVIGVQLDITGLGANAGNNYAPVGVLLEKSGGTHSLARGILKYLKRIPLPYAISLIGYLVSIPVFCDAAFVILSNLNKTLSKPVSYTHLRAHETV